MISLVTKCRLVIFAGQALLGEGDEAELTNATKQASLGSELISAEVCTTKNLRLILLSFFTKTKEQWFGRFLQPIEVISLSCHLDRRERSL
jgi:hypothetical protein